MNRFKNVQRIDAVIGLGAITALTVILVPLMGTAGGVLAGVVGTVLALQRRFHLDRLDARSKASNPANDWDVESGGVAVGKISDSDYARICHQVYGDWTRYLLQVREILRMSFRMIDSLLIVIPAIVFWCVVGMAMAAPDMLVTIIRDVGAASLGEVISAMKPFMSLFILTTIGVAPFFGRFRPVNVFHEEIIEQVRRHVGVAACGRLTLTWCRYRNDAVPFTAAFR